MERFFRFLNRSPTVYHAAKEIEVLLDEADFTYLDEGEKWSLEYGKSYYVARDDSLIAAFRIPLKTPQSTTILASHIDSPALKIKPRPECSTLGIGQIATEPYGGPLLHTWLDRELAIAGRILVINSSGMREAKLVYLDDYAVIIPGLAIHLDKTMNEKGLILKKQDHLRAICTIRSKEELIETCIKKHQPFQKLLSFDLFLVPIQKASFLGFENELIASYRLDNLTSAFASVEALIQAKADENRIQMALLWDHEEIGSKTFTGADSFFVDQILERILFNFKQDREDYYRLKSRSLCLSCDVGHGYNPNYSEKYDAQNAAFLGKGPIVKFSSKYATNGSSAAALQQIADKKNIRLQTFASHSDIGSGSTVGAIMAANLGIPTVDLGIACWSMHSIRETIAVQDQIDLTALLYESL